MLLHVFCTMARAGLCKNKAGCKNREQGDLPGNLLKYMLLGYNMRREQSCNMSVFCQLK